MAAAALEPPPRNKKKRAARKGGYARKNDARGRLRATRPSSRVARRLR